MAACSLQDGVHALMVSTEILAQAACTQVPSEVAWGHPSQVADRTLQLGLGLGLALAAVLGLSSGALPALFTRDPAVTAAISRVFPWVVLSQPLNALAFTWDGILYGAGGFQYAAKARAPADLFHSRCVIMPSCVSALRVHARCALEHLIKQQ
jgi:hypothetical protein